MDRPRASVEPFTLRIHFGVLQILKVRLMALQIVEVNSLPLKLTSAADYRYLLWYNVLNMW